MKFNPPLAQAGWERSTALAVPAKPQYAVAADGQRFLMNVIADEASPITIVQNWTAALKNPEQ